MNVLPSTSTIREPDACLMNSGDAPTALNARTGLSTPPGRMARARVKRFDERRVFMANSQWLNGYASGFTRPFSHKPSAISHDKLREQTGGVACVVRDDDVGSGAPDGSQRFDHRARLVDPAVARGRLEHRVLAADVIGRG